MRDPALWARLSGHTIRLSDGRTLVAAVADELGVRVARAEVIVREYQRFLYLVAATGRPLAPSRPVDAAWHLHLGDPQSYDTALCDGVIGRRIQHAGGGPGPRDDPAYAATFAAYREEFGLRPPWRIWPSQREDGRATAAMVTTLLALGAGLVSLRSGLTGLALLSGTAAAAAASAYAVIAPVAAANRVPEGCTGCVAGLQPARDMAAPDRAAAGGPGA